MILPQWTSSPSCKNYLNFRICRVLFLDNIGRLFSKKLGRAWYDIFIINYFSINAYGKVFFGNRFFEQHRDSCHKFVLEIFHTISYKGSKGSWNIQMIALSLTNTNFLREILGKKFLHRLIMIEMQLVKCLALPASLSSKLIFLVLIPGSFQP